MGRILAAKTAIYDLQYDDLAQDWAVAGGDLVLISDMEEIVSQLLKDALESRFGSMRLLLPDWGWGFEARDYSFVPPDNDLAIRKTKTYMREIVHVALARFWATVKLGDFTFPERITDPDEFSIRIVGILSDRAGTTFDHLLSWDAVTKRATVT